MSSFPWPHIFQRGRAQPPSSGHEAMMPWLKRFTPTAPELHRLAFTSTHIDWSNMGQFAAMCSMVLVTAGTLINSNYIYKNHVYTFFSSTFGTFLDIFCGVTPKPPSSGWGLSPGCPDGCGMECAGPSVREIEQELLRSEDRLRCKVQ